MQTIHLALDSNVKADGTQRMALDEKSQDWYIYQFCQGVIL